MDGLELGFEKNRDLQSLEIGSGRACDKSYGMSGIILCRLRIAATDCFT